MVAGSNPATPTIDTKLRKTTLLTKSQLRIQANLLTKFLKSRGQGTSPKTIEFYQSCLTPFVRHYEITPEGINAFLADLNCGNGKLNYYNAITVFVHWLLGAKYLKDNPLEWVEKPKRAKKLLPSVNDEQVEILLNQVANLRDKCLFRSTCSLSSYGRTFYLHPDRDYRLIGPIPRGTDLWQEKYNARTRVERAYSEEKGSHRLANPRVRGLSRG